MGINDGSVLTPVDREAAKTVEFGRNYGVSGDAIREVQAIQEDQAMNGNDDRLTLYAVDHTGGLWSMDMSSFDDGELRFVTRSLRAMAPRRAGVDTTMLHAKRGLSTMATVASMAALAMGSYASIARSSGLFKPPVRGGRR